MNNNMLKTNMPDSQILNENETRIHNLPEIETEAKRILEDTIDSLKTESYTGLDNSPAPSIQDIANLINEVAKNGVTNYEEFSKFAGSTRFSHKNIVISTEMRLDCENPFFFLSPNLEKTDTDKIKNETLKKLITTLSKKYGIEAPNSLALSTYKLYGNKDSMSMTLDGELSINVKPALLDRKQKNFGFSLPDFLNGIYHELQHRRQFTYTSEFFKENKSVAPKYEFLAKLLFIEHCLNVAQNNGLIDASYLSDYSYYFSSLCEVDARVTAAKEMLSLIKNPYVDTTVKKRLYKNLPFLVHYIFGTNSRDIILFEEMQKYTNRLIRDFYSIFGGIDFARDMIKSLPKYGVAGFIKEANDVKKDLALMHKIYLKNNVLNLKNQTTQIKEEIINQAKIVNEILHKTPILAKETLKAAKNLPANTLYRLGTITGNICYIAKNIYENRKINKKKNADVDKEMER